MKISYNHLLRHIESKPTIDQVSEYLFQLGHENEIDKEIIDIEITPNRGDCLSILGLLRELSVFYELTYPEILFDNQIKPLDLNFKNNAHNVCENITFLKIDIEGEIDSYKDELSDYFKDLRLKENNFFTDISNYISYETGQPTHCYDFLKINNHRVTLKEINDDIEFESLFDNKIKLKGKNAVFEIDGEVINLAGVMGGKSTACNKNTKSVLVECAYFNPESIIGKSIKYDIQSDAAYKFERGVDRSCHEYVLRRFLSIVNKHVKISNVQIFNENNISRGDQKILFDFEKVKSILGIDLDKNKCMQFLNNLGFSFIDDFVIIPSFRNDISCQNDLAEEIARCMGYDDVPSDEIIIPKGKETIENSIENNIKEFLASNGFYEVINFPFNSEYHDKSIVIDNPLDKNKKFLRTNLRDSLIESLLYNERRQQDSIKLFELSNIYSCDESLKSQKRLGIIASGRVAKDYLNFSKKIDEKYLSELLSKLLDVEEINIQTISRESLKSKKKDEIIYYESDISHMPQAIADYKSDFVRPEEFVIYDEISEQPFSTRDLSFSVLDLNDMLLLEKTLNKFKSDVLKEKFVFDYYNNEKTKELKIGYRFIFQSQKETIKEKEVDKVLNDIIQLTTDIKSVSIPGLN